MDNTAQNALRGTASLYQCVIQDVVKNIREAFVDEGIDEVVIKDLKELWEQKLAATKVLEKDSLTVTRNVNAVSNHIGLIGSTQYGPQKQFIQNVQPQYQQRVSYSMNNTVQIPGQALRTTNMVPNFVATVPINSNLPISGPSTSQRVFSMPMVTSGQQINVVDNRPVKYLIVPQRLEVNSSGNIVVGNASNVGLQNSGGIITVSQSPLNVAAVQQQSASARSQKSSQNIVQLDGPPGEISDDEDDFENIDEEDEILEEDENVDFVEEGEPLNSDDDDLVNENADELFEADDIVVCQYENVTRSRSKWKFFLKDGIMNLNGKDYVFSKATGESEF